MKTEKQLHAYLRKQCRANGISFDKVESRSRRGFPDCFLAFRGVIVLAELKSPSGTGRLSELQKAVITDLSAHGVAVMVIDSPAGVDQVIKRIKDSARANDNA